jgi:hypothetical protein
MAYFHSLIPVWLDCDYGPADFMQSGWSGDEGMTDGPPTFAHLVFGPGGVSQERLSRPIKAVSRCGPGVLLGVQARSRRVQDRLGLG